jgi:hypothetical protein
VAGFQRQNAGWLSAVSRQAAIAAVGASSLAFLRFLGDSTLAIAGVSCVDRLNGSFRRFEPFGIELFLALQLSLVHSGDPFRFCRVMLADLSNFQPIKMRLAKNCEVA